MRHLCPILALLFLCTTGASADKLALKPCHPDGAKRELRCGILMVPENRARPGGRMLPLEVVVVPARHPSGKEPVVFLTGGPGQAGTAQAPGFADYWITDQHDMMMVNFRGTGRGTKLDCPEGGTDEHPEEYVEPLFHEGPAYASCAKALAKKADLTQYSTDAAMEDLEDARKALGYGKIDLLGGSYGTRAAIVYMHRHAQNVRAAILSGVVPFSNRSPLYHAAAAERAFETLAKQCAADPACHRAFPDPKGDLDAILAKLRAHPARVTLKKHPKTGRPFQVTLTASGFSDGLRVMLYNETMGRRVPLLLHRARAGDYGPFAELAMEQGRGLKQDLAMGLLLSVECSEDTDRIHPEEVAKATAGSFIGDYRVRGQMAACNAWPKAELRPDYATPYKTGVPVLLISGNLDPVTPPQWGTEAAKYFPNSRHIAVPGAHVSDSPCIDSIMKQFLRSANARASDTSCIAKAKLPPFVTAGK